MARRRMISPELWESEDFSSLSRLGKIVWIGLFSLADDEGRGRANPAYLKSRLFPYEDKLRVTDIKSTLCEIACRMSIIFYATDSGEFYELTHWEKWQSVNRPTPSQVPKYHAENDRLYVSNEGSLNTHGALTEGSLRAHAQNKRKENKRKEVEVEAERARAKAAATPAAAPSIADDDLYSEDMANIVKVYEDNVAPISPHVYECMMNYLNEGTTVELVIYAIGEAAENNARNWRYIDAILKRCANAGIKTAREACLPKGNDNSLLTPNEDTDAIERAFMAAYGDE